MVCSAKQWEAVVRARAAKRRKADALSNEVQALRLANVLNRAAWDRARGPLTFPYAAFSAAWMDADPGTRAQMAGGQEGSYQVLATSVAEDRTVPGWFHIQMTTIRLDPDTGRPNWTYEPFTYPVNEEFLLSLPGFADLMCGEGIGSIWDTVEA